MGAAKQVVVTVRCGEIAVLDGIVGFVRTAHPFGGGQEELDLFWPVSRRPCCRPPCRSTSNKRMNARVMDLGLEGRETNR